MTSLKRARLTPQGKGGSIRSGLRCSSRGIIQPSEVGLCIGNTTKVVFSGQAKWVECMILPVLIKIADGPSWRYNYDETMHGIDLIPPLVAELRKVGIQPWGWHYILGYDPIGEARLAVSRTRALGLDGYVIDAEAEYKKKGRAKAAKRFMEVLRTGLPDLPVALSTYRYPKTHSEFPYNEFLGMCDYAMPQVYFEGAHNPEEQLDRCVEQYMSLSNARPIIPTAPTYGRGSWRPMGVRVNREMTKK